MESLVLEGSVEAIIFKSEDTGYTVATFDISSVSLIFSDCFDISLNNPVFIIALIIITIINMIQITLTNFTNVIVFSFIFPHFLFSYHVTQYQY